MSQHRDQPVVFSRRAFLKAGTGGVVATIVLAACGAPTPSTSPAATTAPQGAAAPKPTAAATSAAGAAATAPASAAQAAVQTGAGLTTEQISLLFMGHVAGGQNEQKA